MLNSEAFLQVSTISQFNFPHRIGLVLPLYFIALKNLHWQDSQSLSLHLENYHDHFIFCFGYRTILFIALVLNCLSTTWALLKWSNNSNFHLFLVILFLSNGSLRYWCCNWVASLIPKISKFLSNSSVCNKCNVPSFCLIILNSQTSSFIFYAQQQGILFCFIL